MIKRMLLAGFLATSMLAGPANVAGAQDVVEQAKKGRAETAVFGKRPFMRDPRLSPDGTKIAVMMSRNGVDNLGYIDLSKPGAPPVFIAKSEEYREAGDRTMQSWRWVGNRTILFTLMSRENTVGQRIDLARLVAYDLESGKMTPLAWDGAGGDAATIIYIDDEGERILLQRSTFRDLSFGPGPEVLDVDVRTGKYKQAMRPNVEVQRWLADGKGVIRAGVGQDDKGNQRLMYRSGDSGYLSTVANAKDTTFTNSHIVPSIFLDEPDMAYAISNKDDFRRVYKVNMKTLEIVGSPLFEVPGYDVGGLIQDESGSKMLGVAYTSDRGRTKWMDPRLAQIQQFFDEDFGDGNAEIVSTNDGDTKLIVKVAKASDPGGYYLYDTASGRMQLVGWTHPVLKGASMNPTDTVKYKASDGMEIEAVVTYPRHRKHREKLPVVVMPHGGPFGVRDEEGFGFFSWHQALAELGYVVIQPNYRGSGGFGKNFVLEGRKPDGYGNRMQEDLNDAVTWFAGTGLVDKDRACVMGWSYGGYAAARGAQRDPGVWKCAIAGAGLYDFPMMKAYDTNAFGSFGANFQATADDLVAVSSARHPQGTWSPILIVAALRDARIPIEQSRTLVSRLKGAGKKEDVDFRYVEQPKGTHNLPYEDVHIEWLVEAEKWLARFNPAYVATDKDKPVPVTVTANGK